MDTNKQTHKTCNKCGLEKNIIKFRSIRNKYYSRSCIKCIPYMCIARSREYLNDRKLKDKIYRDVNKSRAAKVRSSRQKKEREEISDSYIRLSIKANCNLRTKDITQELIELKRMNVKIKRKLKEG